MPLNYHESSLNQVTESWQACLKLTSGDDSIVFIGGILSELLGMREHVEPVSTLAMNICLCLFGSQWVLESEYFASTAK